MAETATDVPDVDSKRPRQEDDIGPPSKKQREEPTTFTRLPSDVSPAVSRLGLKPLLPTLPASLELITGTKADLSATNGFVGEAEVGIIGYVGDASFSGVKGIIKQRYEVTNTERVGLTLSRFTDFLVNEISMSGDILHLKNIGKPEEAPQQVEQKDETPQAVAQDLPAELQFEVHPDWTPSTTAALRPHLADETIKALHALLFDGKHPRPTQDAGWGSRQARQEDKANEEEMAMNQSDPAPVAQGRPRGRGRGGRMGGGRDFVKDTREVVSQVCRTNLAEEANDLWLSTARRRELPLTQPFGRV
jgi:tRNA pseudouridine13 synthase